MKLILPFPVRPSSSSSCLDSGCGDTQQPGTFHTGKIQIGGPGSALEWKCKMQMVAGIRCIWASLLLIPDFFGNVFLNVSKCWVTQANTSPMRSSFSKCVCKWFTLCSSSSPGLYKDLLSTVKFIRYVFRSKVWSFQNLWKYFVLKKSLFCFREISLLNLKTT